MVSAFDLLALAVKLQRFPGGQSLHVATPDVHD